MGIKRRIGMVAAATVTAVVAGAGVAEAKTFTTTITALGHTGLVSNYTEFGRVSSTKAKCVPDRKVKVYANHLSGPVLVDVARTSDNGAWAATGDFSGAGGLTAKVTKEDVGKNTCGSDTVNVPFA